MRWRLGVVWRGWWCGTKLVPRASLENSWFRKMIISVKKRCSIFLYKGLGAIRDVFRKSLPWESLLVLNRNREPSCTCSFVSADMEGWLNCATLYKGLQHLQTLVFPARGPGINPPEIPRDDCHVFWRWSFLKAHRLAPFPPWIFPVFIIVWCESLSLRDKPINKYI